MRRRLDPYSGRPLYRQVADDLRDAIAVGELRPGELLPTESRLAGDYEIGVDAVRDALAVLRGEGLVETLRGRGTSVRQIPEPTVVKIPPGARIAARMPTEDERRQLGIVEGTPILEVDLHGEVRLLPGDRYALETVEDTDDAAPDA
jgi:DNA-binding GntR family transcriptional regulator